MKNQPSIFVVAALMITASNAAAHIGDTDAVLEKLRPAAIVLAQPSVQPAAFGVAKGEICVFEPDQTAFAFDTVGGQSTQPVLLACVAE